MRKKLIMNTQYIDVFLQRNNIDKIEFAKRCSISRSELDDVYNQKCVDIFVLIKIVDVLHITSDTFLFMEKHYPKQILKKTD